MSEELKLYKEKVFDEIRHTDGNGIEFWYARELMVALKYTKWQNFKKTVEKAMIACDVSKNNTLDHFADASKTIKMPKGATKEVDDFKLSRYACYLIVQNADPRKELVALGQTYFAYQTRKMELTEAQFLDLPEDERRLYTRYNVKNKNLYLFKAAHDAGVKDYGKFNNYGYQGLYNGETASVIAKRKGISENEDILDYMGSEELGANLFRITQTEAKLKKDKVNTEDDACDTHFTVGKAIRKTIEELGGTMPEKLPTPDKSIQDLEHEKLKKISPK